MHVESLGFYRRSISFLSTSRYWQQWCSHCVGSSWSTTNWSCWLSEWAWTSSWRQDKTSPELIGITLSPSYSTVSAWYLLCSSSDVSPRSDTVLTGSIATCLVFSPEDPNQVFVGTDLVSTDLLKILIFLLLHRVLYYTTLAIPREHSHMSIMLHQVVLLVINIIIKQ